MLVSPHDATMLTKLEVLSKKQLGRCMILEPHGQVIERACSKTALQLFGPLLLLTKQLQRVTKSLQSLVPGPHSFAKLLRDSSCRRRPQKKSVGSIQ